MAVLATQNFDIGPDGAAFAPTASETATGTGTLTYSSTSAINGAYGLLVTVTSTNFAYVTHTLPAGTLGYWHSVSFYMPDPPPSPGPTYIISGGTGATKAADVRINSDRTLSIRDQANAKWTSPSATPIAAGAKVRLSFKCFPGSTTGLRLRVYVGTNYSGTTPDYDSGDLASTSSLTSVTSAREGVIAIPTAAVAIGFDAVTIDGTDEPAAPGAAGTNVKPTVTAGSAQVAYPFTTVTLTSVGTDTDGTIASYTWRQVSGTPAITLAGSGSTRTFTVPTVRVAGDVVFGVVVTDNKGAASTESTTTVTVLPTTEYAVVGGVEVPLKLSTV